MARKKFKIICQSCGKEHMACRPTIRFCTSGCNVKAEKSPAWKGDAVGLGQLHDWIEKQMERPDSCSKCGKRGKVDLANISNEYKRDISDWEWLCRKCHMTSDGRLNNFLSYSQNRKIPNRECDFCGVSYWPHTRTSKYCSHSCRATANNYTRMDYKNRKHSKQKHIETQ